jgi:hypothetical protein
MAVFLVALDTTTPEDLGSLEADANAIGMRGERVFTRRRTATLFAKYVRLARAKERYGLRAVSLNGVGSGS